MKHLISCFTVFCLTASTSWAQQPRITNGQVQPLALSGSLDRTIRDLAARSSDPVWVGYAVPIIPGEHNMCCWSSDGSAGSCCTGCRLEPGSSNTVRLSTADSSTRLEPGDAFFVLFRLEQKEVNRIRMFSEDCPLDAGGRTIHWLTGVRPAESVAVLAAYAAAPDRKPADSALSAINAESTHVRGQALFWLAQRAGEKAVGTITEAIERDPETDVKKRAVFALSQLPKDQGVPLLIDIARKNANPVVKKQAIFWLGQSKDPRALQFFEEILFKK
jgi:HEAT repeats